MATEVPGPTPRTPEEDVRSLGDTRLAPLAEIGRLRTTAAGEALYRQGERSATFSVLLRGRAKMFCRSPEGRSQIMALYTRGDVIGFAGAMSGSCSRATVEATERCVCQEVQTARLFRLFREQPEVVERLLPALASGVVDCRRCFLELVSGRVDRRMARLFTDLAGELGVRRGEGVAIPLPLSRQDLADLAGTTIETSIRVMSRWSRRGLVETRADGFLVRDRAALDRLREG